MKPFQEYKDLVENNLLRYMPSPDPQDATLFDAMTYSLTAGGKRLRPVMVLAAADLAGGSLEDAMPFACAMEYIHTYSLIHDDLPAMDDDDLRRGKPTNHAVYGAGMATLAGDGLLSQAFDVMTKAVLRAAESEGPEAAIRAVRALEAVSQGAGVQGMVAGQAADLVNEDRPPSEEALIFIHRNKTGAMIRGAIRAGLLRAGADDQTLEAMTVYAEKLGLAFQIADDILDVVGTAEELGKNPGSDEEEGKLTWVSLYGMKASRERLHQLTLEAEDAISELAEKEFFLQLVRKLETRTK